MKRVVLVLWLLVLVRIVSANTWIPYGPSGVTTYNICFLVDSQSHNMICAENGFYLTDFAGANANFYTYGLPVFSGRYYDGQNIMLIQGGGSWSDGIWLFSNVNQQFSVLEYCVRPHFLVQDLQNHYYVGYQYGIKYSEDGLTWTDLPYFASRECFDMVFLSDSHAVVSFSDGSSNHVAVTDDSGVTWNNAINAPPLTDLDILTNDAIIGVFPGFSNSSGLWSSVDGGMNWTVLLYTDELQTAGHDMAGRMFIGWNNTTGTNNGVAYVNPQNFIPEPCNAGLTDLHIFHFAVNIIMSSIHLFCCTGDGVFFMNDFVAGLDQQVETHSGFRLYPNPSAHVITIIPDKNRTMDDIMSISIYDSKGVLYDEDHRPRTLAGTPMWKHSVESYPPGMYFVKMKHNLGVTVLKLLVY